MTFDDSKRGVPPVIDFDCKMGELTHIPNTRRRPIKVTVRLGDAGEVSFVCIIGGAFSILAGNTAPTIRFEELDDV